jgi:phytoene synthase
MKLDSSLVTRAAPPGSMRYYAWLYAPEQHRDYLAALFLIESELHDSARAPHEVAHIRLQWWREEVARLIASKAQHPATQVLQAAARPNADFEVLQETALSAAQELANVTYETDAELTQYLRGGLGALLTLAAQHLSPKPTEPLLNAASQIGAFIRQVEITRDIRQDFHHGRLYLPLATLDQLNIEYEALQTKDWPDAFVQLLKSRSQQQLAAYKTLQQDLPTAEKQTLRPLLVLGDLHARLLQTLIADPVTHTRQRLELGPMQKLWTAWRAARAAR